MNIAVAGLWHLGSVTAACMATAGHVVTGYDDDTGVVENFRKGLLPVAEPGLNELVAEAVRQERLRFTSEPADLAGNEILWVCWDTPVSDDDIADTEFVIKRILALLPNLDDGSTVLISSQLQVGSTARLEAEHGQRGGQPNLSFAYSPENLRLGKAVEVFRNPDRVVVGIREPRDRERIEGLFRGITQRIEWMSVESAEMTKHALNTFLATSVSFINEIATLCERVGADALDVERGLKTDVRIGPGAYLHAGSAFAGGTLARDLSFLLDLGSQFKTSTPLLAGVRQSNNGHKEWTQHRFSELLGDLQGKRIAVLGLTYKPGTNTLRRSSAIEVCRWLVNRGAEVIGYDPALTRLPEEVSGVLRLATGPVEALSQADAVLIGGAWPEFRDLEASAFFERMRKPLILDPSRSLDQAVANNPRVQYVAIGKSI